MGSEFNLGLASPRATDELTAAEAHFGVQLPSDYRSLMLEHDGGEGFIGSHYFILWQSGELQPFNEAYEFPEYAPSLIAFGSDGGGGAFAFDRRDVCLPVVVVPFIGMSDEDAIRVADSFDHFLDRMKSNDTLF